MVITGQMSGESKATVLDVFRSGRCRLLLSTVVIEVGIDVPDATLMVVEHAERFGLLQLHQLRGRVGRSDKQSSCTLVTTAKGPQERLHVLTVRPSYSATDAHTPPRLLLLLRSCWDQQVPTPPDSSGSIFPVDRAHMAMRSGKCQVAV